jgi:hypothetical protein
MAHDHVGHASADDQYQDTPAGSGYEHTDASVWTIVKFAFWLALSAIIIHVGLGLMYQMLIEQAKSTTEQQYPLATARDPQLPPTPRLQQFPRNEVYDFRLDEERRLHSYGWVNKDAGTVHIPIDDAMRLILQRGLASRTQDPSRPAETPGLMPSDSSSGRVMERRRQ